MAWKWRPACDGPRLLSRRGVVRDAWEAPAELDGSGQLPAGLIGFTDRSSVGFRDDIHTTKVAARVIGGKRLECPSSQTASPRAVGAPHFVLRSRPGRTQRLAFDVECEGRRARKRLGKYWLSGAMAGGQLGWLARAPHRPADTGSLSERQSAGFDRIVREVKRHDCH